MEYIEQILFRKVNPSDFKKLYNIDKPAGGGGQTYIELAGIEQEKLLEFLKYAEMNSAPFPDGRMIYTINAYVLGGKKSVCKLMEFAPRNGRNYKISRQTEGDKHPAWRIENGFPEPKKDLNGNYMNTFGDLLKDLLIFIIRTNYKKYYASFFNANHLPSSWPKNLGLEDMITGDRRGIINFKGVIIGFNNNKSNPFKILSPSDVMIEKVEKTFNRIIFGAPGTGKSYILNNDKNVFNNRYERVTFYPTYTYSQFVGTYKPTADIDRSGEKTISYEFVPGPFLRIFVQAVNNPLFTYGLLIEELNRANAPAVFGDIFQLLDRNDDGTSVYSIHPSEDMKAYLKKEIINSDFDISEISLPKNMYIWSTMNSADQGVFPMDTAFKRRWNYEYIGIDQMEEGISGYDFNLGEDAHIVNWNVLRKAINDLATKCNINEDKLLGPYFLSPEILMDNNKFIESFKSKVIMYLYEDAAKHCQRKLFKGCTKLRYSDICQLFDEIGENIFGKDFLA